MWLLGIVDEFAMCWRAHFGGRCAAVFAMSLAIHAARADAPPADAPPAKPPPTPVAMATPEPQPNPPPDTKTAIADKAPAKPSPYAKWIAAGSVAAIHLGYATWSYFAWYHNSNTEDFHLEEPSAAFGANTYAGGADKFGHFWSNYTLTRATTAVLVAGGWDRLPSSLVSAGLTEVAFTLTELEDGFVKYGFDYKDVIANASGAAFAVLMDNVPAIDRLFDFRLQYFPSRDYRRSFEKTGSVDIGQDYTGQSYMLALHLGALPRMNDYDVTYWTRFVDLAVGFEARYYSPAPEMRTEPPRQTVYVGLSVNMQYVLTHLFADSTGARIGRGFFEVYSLPYTTFRYVEASRKPE